MQDDGALLTYSAGVAQYPEDGQDLDELIDAADVAQYRAKVDGKNRVLPAGLQHDGQVGRSAGTVDVAVVGGEECGAQIVRSLDAAGFRVQWIRDGEAAALKLGGSDPAIHAQVVVLDLDAPVLDGLAVLRRLARDGVMSRTRIIVISGAAGDMRARKAMEIGAFAQVSRPVNLLALQQRVRYAMEVP
jgi:PleD family two-component response regulator